MRGIDLHSLFAGNTTLGIPTFVHVAYQMMFAIITPALITGAFANRVTFKAYMWFLTAWLIFVYFPFCHMVWIPTACWRKWGVLDFAGGIVVHNTAGLAALASVLFVGQAQGDRHHPAQHSAGRPGHRPAVVRLVRLQRRQRIPGGLRDRLRLHQHRRRRLLRRRHLAGGGMDERQQPKFLGLLTGAVAGLATITPAAGYVSPRRLPSSASSPA